MAISRSYLLVRYKYSVLGQRLYSSMSDKRGLVLGVYSTDGQDDVRLTKFAQKYNESTSGKLLEQIKICGPISSGSARIYWDLGKYPAVAVAGLGDASKWDELDEINGVKENVRIAAAAGVRALSACKIGTIEVEDLEDAEAAAEGAGLANYKFQEYKNKEKQTSLPTVALAENNSGSEEWDKGSILADAQNWARKLMETPANLMTPTIFSENVKTKLASLNVDVQIYDEEWARVKQMGSFLSVTNGTKEPAKFLEITYKGDNSADKCIALVGKGVTFDSGGISLKPSASMDQMRADMGGAANVAATIYALARQKVPVHVKGFIPLCENMPSGTATKPGDVVFAMNGKSICVDNTDAEGRLILADALCYASTFNPLFILDIATLTGAIKVALGDCVAGVFSTSNKLWEQIHEAGYESGDRVWRMPLFKHYSDQMCDHNGYDLNNLGKGKGGGSCTAAAFLRQFVDKETPWLHVDIAGVMGDCSDQSYTGSKGMTGRPMRTLVQFIKKAGS
ncbi:cytosol aminopeptidase-like isoform X2 [Toxorhynchites rutilus septentrionalis]|uniref:cytosol aminopeptidase-like isoform X2 n=1 Tax=Toxorhynchites rutilus septentrionalis TaxID=329112 RepID=UPI002478A873|nr:cytosol aminopeptidase-like isoform X2 [Toxorhynchites rutilus septentrionalis]